MHGHDKDIATLLEALMYMPDMHDMNMPAQAGIAIA